jgi:hypothetical protein
MQTRPPTTAEFFIIVSVCAVVCLLVISQFVRPDFWSSVEGLLTLIGVIVVAGVVPFCRDMWNRPDKDDLGL